MFVTGLKTHGYIIDYRLTINRLKNQITMNGPYIFHCNLNPKPKLLKTFIYGCYIRIQPHNLLSHPPCSELMYGRSSTVCRLPNQATNWASEPSYYRDWLHFWATVDETLCVISWWQTRILNQVQDNGISMLKCSQTWKTNYMTVLIMLTTQVWSWIR